MALNLIRRARGKDPLRLRRKVAAWDDDFLASLIASSFVTRFPWPGPPLRRRRIDPRGLQKVTARGKEYQAWPQAQVTEAERVILTCHAD
jgi:hypothetical protein